MSFEQMERFAEHTLRRWLSQRRRKPLVIRGARQVGKTTLVRQFAAAAGMPLCEVNLERHLYLDRIFQSLDTGRIVRELEAIGGVRLAGSILFLDEVQATPGALHALRYLYEDRPDLPVLAAGSLLEFTLADHSFSMPVGRIEYLHVGPMSFAEFLTAVDPPLAEHLNTFQLGGHLPRRLDYTDAQAADPSRTWRSRPRRWQRWNRRPFEHPDLLAALDQRPVGPDHPVHVAQRAVGPEPEQPEQLRRRGLVHLVEQRQREVLLRPDPRPAEIAEQQVPLALAPVQAGAVPDAAVEHQHRARRPGGGDALHVRLVRRQLRPQVTPRHQPRAAVLLRVVLQHPGGVDHHPKRRRARRIPLIRVQRLRLPARRRDIRGKAGQHVVLAQQLRQQLAQHRMEQQVAEDLPLVHQVPHPYIPILKAMKVVQLTMDPELISRVDDVAKRLSTTRSAFARAALRAALDRYEEAELEAL